MSEQNQPIDASHDEAQHDENAQVALRREKLSRLRELGQAFPNDFRRDATAADVHAQYGDKSAEELEALKARVVIAGRMMTRRDMGKASFATLQDMGGRIQAYVRLNDLPDGQYEQFKSWDLGDIIGVEGHVFRTRTGELSVHASSVRILTKALRPLPDKFHGLADMEQRYRQRYLDLIANPESRQTFLIRSQVVSGIRQFMSGEGFLEVETPMMHVIPGGAAARPFETHHNALDMPLFLRIAPELYLKRLTVGGFEKVFEINRNFRNEGVSTRHNPEFTMMEFYWAYADYHDLMNLTEALFKRLALDILGTTELPYGEEVYDFGKPFARLTIPESIVAHNEGVTLDELQSLEGARAVAARLGLAVHASWGLGKLQTHIFEETVEHKLRQPTFVYAYPTEVSPLARRNDQNPEVTDRFELFIGGREIANGFSELNDPEDQAQRFQDQVKAKDAGDLEAMYFDADYITALEHGLPPTAGEGIGIDRLVMLFANAPSIRDVILFPHMRQRSAP
ncbi:MAG: lysine--tRNA ligase [Gammaproteobacteria bacterium]|nr:lysine--tRNA ligase [Gammaproteobacteria bacterium]